MKTLASDPNYTQIQNQLTGVLASPTATWQDVLSVLGQFLPSGGSGGTLSTLSVDYNSGKTQVQAILGASGSAWQALLPTETGDTLTSFISTVHASAQQNIIRSYQDAYPQTAAADSAIYAAAVMQGVRLNRKLPASLPVVLTNSTSLPVSFAPYSSFQGANSSWFNRQVIVVPAKVGTTEGSVSAILYQGLPKQVSTQGLGSPYSIWVSPENSFFVSDVDTVIFINNSAIPNIPNGIWSSNLGSGFIDGTMANGNLRVEFGDGTYGSLPAVSDSVLIGYVVTNGASANSINALNKVISSSGNPGVKAVATANPTGGADETPAIRYKNIAAYSFGTFGSGVTKSQFLTTVLQYPGVTDGITFSQREVQISDLRWMNLTQVSVLTSSVWSSTDITNFIRYLEKSTLYSTRFIVVPPTPKVSNVFANVYCKSWANLDIAKTQATSALNKLFSNATLNYDIMVTDITDSMLKSYSGIDYIDLITPTTDLVVSTPQVARPTVTVIPGGTLPAGCLVYSVGYTTATEDLATGVVTYTPVIPTGQVYEINGSNTQAQISWQPVPNAVSYQIYGRGSGSSPAWGLVSSVAGLGSGLTVGQAMAGFSVNAIYDMTSSTFTLTDTGSIPPTAIPVAAVLGTKQVLYNKLGLLTVNTSYSRRASGASNYV